MVTVIEKDAAGNVIKESKVVAPFIQCSPKNVAVAAAELLAKGRSMDEICQTMKQRAEEDPTLLEEETSPPEPAETPAPEDDDLDQESIEDYLKHRYFMAYLRLTTGKIEDLGLEEMSDIAALATTPAFSFSDWAKRKGYVDAG